MIDGIFYYELPDKYLATRRSDMTSVKQYSLPTYRQGHANVKRVRDELIRRYRLGDHLDTEELDWLDWAEISLDRPIKTR